MRPTRIAVKMMGPSIVQTFTYIYICVCYTHDSYEVGFSMRVGDGLLEVGRPFSLVHAEAPCRRESKLLSLVLLPKVQ